MHVFQSDGSPATSPNGVSKPIDIPGKKPLSLPRELFDQRMQNVNGLNSMPAKVNHAGTMTPNSAGNGHLSVPLNGMKNGTKIKSAQDIWAIQHARKQEQRRHKMDYARPMYRKDIFYSGSVLHIPQFHSQPDMKSYLRSTTSIPQLTNPETECCFWRCCPKSTKDIIKNMLDVRVFKDPVFLIACISNALGMLGLYVPFVFVAERAIAFDVSENKAAFLLSVIGECGYVVMPIYEHA